MTDRSSADDKDQSTDNSIEGASERKTGRKNCTLCYKSRDVLVRCQIDETGKWHFVCPGKCWTSVSGGEVDAKGHKDDFPFYRYGGMWKNRHADGPLNAKKPKKKAPKQQNQEDAGKDRTSNATGMDAYSSEETVDR
ncbi:hypothetical protein AMS68_006280 [Peltaster fructicola]|uniref:Uncharacterized protein n=1 Tax=Peltaster fructicola TaxID=286661 RepID=A0A6H0Y178_9PEZI|nr:hypothetical protein AMS68_006280 [Peltaster fructicola]